jgi:4-hydroxy-tetrahydrodipicolinate synthase
MPVNVSEGPMLTDSERDQVVRATVKAVGGAVPVVAGVSGVSVAHSVERAKSAAEAGADSLIAAPANGSTPEVMEELYVKLAEAARLPIWIQNNKPPTSPTLPTSLMVKLLRGVKHVDYVKEESLLPGHVITELIEGAGESVKGIMGGMGGRFLVDEYRRGGCGTMPAGHITDAHRKLWDALEKGGRDSDGLQVVSDEARDIWERMIPSLNFEFMFSVAAYKMAFFRRGVIKTAVTRNPAAKPLDKLDVEELDLILDRLGDLLDD